VNIVIVYGGKSGEHEVSLVSAASVARNIPEAGNTVSLIGIAKNGAWYLQDSALLTKIRENTTLPLSIQRDEVHRVNIVPGGGSAGALVCSGTPIPADVVFPVLHGTYGEDGTIQGLFEMAEIPYVGGGVMSSSLAMDKEKTKIIWQALGLPIVPFVALTTRQWITDEKKVAACNSVEQKFPWPVFVKPACAGSSVGAAKANTREELITRINEAFIWDKKVLIEPFISAREIECSVTGNGKATTYIPGEIVPNREFYDYQAKYQDPDGAALTVPANLSPEQTKKVTSLAAKAYEALDLDGMARVDFFIDKKNGELYLNEINTIPGFTPISMFSRMCEAGGLNYQDLVMALLDLARERFTSSRTLQTDRP